jgi:AcrR family transcriptional regulator
MNGIVIAVGADQMGNSKAHLKRRAPGGRPKPTRQRLLEAAGEVFAERGFRGATVELICRRAGVNIAAVNYHFGDKRELYAAVADEAQASAAERYPLEPSPAVDVGPQERLAVFIRSLFLRIFDAGRPAWHGKLMAREMVEPTGLLDRLVRDTIRPNHDRLAIVVRELVGPAIPPSAIRLCVLSIVGQCLFYHHARAVIARLYPDLRLEGAQIERLADHVTRFSLAALRGLSRTGPPTTRDDPPCARS